MTTASFLAVAYRRNSAAETRVRMALVMLFVLLNMADVWTTNHALAQGAGIEGNPLMAHVQALAGVWWPVPKMMAAAAIAYLWAVAPIRFMTGALGVVCAVMAFIVWHNWTLIA